ncbi:Aspartate 1-decarboxylase [Synechocystis sp. PCC 6714]|nr:Aspartate 1-decarboxylase [Synechocystis sp. PCC 6714]
MHAKLHRVCVTEANVDYVGSITIDPVMLGRVGLLPLEEVDIINLSNGNRFSTYVLPGQAHSKEICPNGGAALLCQPGDRLIIFAYELCDRAEVLRTGHRAKVLVANEINETVDFYLQELMPKEGGVKFINTTGGEPVHH